MGRGYGDLGIFQQKGRSNSKQFGETLIQVIRSEFPNQSNAIRQKVRLDSGIANTTLSSSDKQPRFRVLDFRTKPPIRTPTLTATQTKHVPPLHPRRIIKKIKIIFPRRKWEGGRVGLCGDSTWSVGAQIQRHFPACASCLSLLSCLAKKTTSPPQAASQNGFIKGFLQTGKYLA